MKPAILVLVGLALCSCEPSLQEKFDQVKVGMTYDEVENLLGKPALISRGVTKLEQGDPERLPDDELIGLLPQPSARFSDPESNLKIQRLEAALFVAKENVRIVSEPTKGSDFLRCGDRKYWAIAPTITETGTLLYVTWIYENVQTDTLLTTLPRYTEIRETTYVDQFFVNGRSVSREKYESARDTVYYAWKADRSSVSEMSSKHFKPHQPQYNSRRVQHWIQQNAYRVDASYCVAFDAASGRVVFSGYHPIATTAI